MSKFLFSLGQIVLLGHFAPVVVWALKAVHIIFQPFSLLTGQLQSERSLKYKWHEICFTVLVGGESSKWQVFLRKIAVKIILGIFQKREAMIRFAKEKNLDLFSLTEVGPFFSKNQAMLWMKELHTQIENSEIVKIQESYEENLQWYGCTFEQ